VREDTLRQLLEQVRAGDIDVDAAVKGLKALSVEDLGYALIDHHRVLRKGFPEVIYAAGKEPAQVAGIFERLKERGHPVLATRVSEQAAAMILAALPDARHNPRARTVILETGGGERRGKVVVLAAGTSDLAVAEEVVETASIMGSRVESVSDVGVAGLHRLLGKDEHIRDARVLVVVAGMDGALPSVVAGLYAMPVVAVPTSVGYGAAFGGLAPLLSMLNSCAPGVGVVNIDNGFGAGYLAHLINIQAEAGS
jgi:NCAIR mutase (PurE)-related protein